jgi:hypothetical protein
MLRVSIIVRFLLVMPKVSCDCFVLYLLTYQAPFDADA